MQNYREPVSALDQKRFQQAYDAAEKASATIDRIQTKVGAVERENLREAFRQLQEAFMAYGLRIQSDEG